MTETWKRRFSRQAIHIDTSVVASYSGATPRVQLVTFFLNNFVNEFVREPVIFVQTLV